MKKPQWVCILPLYFFLLLLLIHLYTTTVAIVIVYSSPDIALIVRPHINRCVTFICIILFFVTYSLSFLVALSFSGRPANSLELYSCFSLILAQSQTHKKSSSYLYSGPLSFLWVWISIEQFIYIFLSFPFFFLLSLQLLTILFYYFLQPEHNNSPTL